MKKRNQQQNSSYGGYAGSVPPNVKRWLDELFLEPETDLIYLRAFAINRQKDEDLALIDEIAEVYRRDQTADFDVIEEYDQPSQLRM